METTTNLTPDNYYDDQEYLSFSGLKSYSKCPVLFKETFIDRTYVEPEQEYFTYGNIVDTYLSDGQDQISKKFIRVARRVSPDDVLRIKTKIEALKNEIEEKDLRNKSEAGNKTAIKGLASREADISELEEDLRRASGLIDPKMTQVVESVFDDALITAATMSINPFFKTLENTIFTTQQIFVNEERKLKGKLDYIRFHPSVQVIYELWRGGLIKTEQEMRDRIQELDPSVRKGMIVDYKTCAQLEKVDPDIWSGQLAFYQDLVEHVTGIKCECYIICGDKGKTKRAQDFVFPQELLDKRKKDIEVYIERAQSDLKNGTWKSAKEMEGFNQKCWKCSVCSDRPFSMDKPFVVTGTLKEMRNAAFELEEQV